MSLVLFLPHHSFPFLGSTASERLTTCLSVRLSVPCLSVSSPLPRTENHHPHLQHRPLIGVLKCPNSSRTPPSFQISYQKLERASIQPNSSPEPQSGLLCGLYCKDVTTHETTTQCEDACGSIRSHNSFAQAKSDATFCHFYL